MLPLGHRDVFHSVAFWLGALYVSFPMGLLLYGWNDIVDYPHRLAFRGQSRNAIQNGGAELRIKE